MKEDALPVMKYLVVIGDGMADFAIDELDGKTPLMVADKPNMDRCAGEGFCGQVVTVPPGFSPGSDVAGMSLFGYDPAECYTGRAPIEAYGMGVTMDESDVAFRCNLVYLDLRGPKVLMGDYCADHITTSEAKSLVEDFAAAAGSEEFRFFPGVSYRHLMRWKNGKSEMVTTPPHDITDKEVINYLPKGPGADRLIKLMSDSQIFLKEHPVNRERIGRGLLPANSIWLWGQGKKPHFPTFYEKYKAEGRGGRGSGPDKRDRRTCRIRVLPTWKGQQDIWIRTTARRPGARSNCLPGTTSCMYTWRRPTKRPMRATFAKKSRP